ncbi:MAG TPA: glucokinase [Devosia sp.]|nr:glucokinase [Devosia sp.]
MTENSRQALVGAIGGTFISLAVMDIDEYSVANFALLNSADFASPMEAIGRYIKSLPRVPDKVGLSVAGAVDGERARMSHLPWTFDWNDIRAVTRSDRICFVNEFEALALATPTLSSYDLITISKGSIKRTATRAVVSAGTGLGAAALAWTRERWVPISGESRLASFPQPLGHEFDIGTVIAHEGFVHAGQVLTGHGLVLLYEALARQASQTPAKLTPAQITKAGLAHEDALAGKALELMATWLGRFAGDVVLHYGATGGLYLAGGMPSNIAPALQSRHFLDAFEGIGERREYLGDTPVHVVKAGADAGLRGAAIALANSLPARGTDIRRLRA